MKKIEYLLQSEIPTNEWLVKDTNKAVIRSKSEDVLDPENLNSQDEITMKKLIDFVNLSQDKNLNTNPKDLLRPAVGLAAPQIGVNKNMFYIKFVDYDNKIYEYAMINLKIKAQSEKQITCLEDGEGCLSVDKDHMGFVPRKNKLIVYGYNWLNKKWENITLRGYLSIVFQHELEHNLGILYYDHINKKNPWFKKDDWILL